MTDQMRSETKKTRVSRAAPESGAGDRESYFGGKGLAFRHLVNQIPPHEWLVIPFAGHCAITRQMALPPKVWLNDIDVEVFRWWCRLLEVPSPKMGAKYFELMTVFNQCGLKMLRDLIAGNCLSESSFVYLDPPYLLTARKSGPRYPHELTEDQHRELLWLAGELPCPVMLSGYWSELYAGQLADWRHFSFVTQTRRGPATEHVWCNYPDPVALQDYRWLGGNKRERFKLARRERNLIDKLDRLPELERRALLAAVDSHFGGRRSHERD